MKRSDPSAQLARLRARNRELKERLQAERVLKAELEAQLQAALRELAELKRQLFGERSDQLTPEEEAQMAEVAADLQEQAEQEPPLSDEVLEDQAGEESDRSKDAPQRKRRRRGRHPLPEHLERQTVVIEPAGLAPCEHCGRPPESIGEEVSEELE